jgi:hypothetical protein
MKDMLSNKTAGDWLILRSPRSKMCLSPALKAVLLEFLKHDWVRSRSPLTRIESR